MKGWLASHSRWGLDRCATRGVSLRMGKKNGYRGAGECGGVRGMCRGGGCEGVEGSGGVRGCEGVKGREGGVVRNHGFGSAGVHD